MDIKSILKQSEILTYINDLIKKAYYKYLISDEKLINKKFKQKLGRNVNLKDPQKYNDKLQWLKLYWYDPLATKCADKYEVRKYVQEKMGSKYLNELLAVYNSVEEIDIDKLPKSFVLKGTHGSGFNIICKYKDKMDWKKEFKKMRRWLRLNYFLFDREWVYKDIKPRIICEKYLSDSTGSPPMDYKIFCFHGEPKLVQVDLDRFGDHIQNFYTPDWEFMNIEIEKQSDRDTKINKPKTLNEMLDLSKKLSAPFPHVRVDFYEVDAKVIFGELTFFHQSGYGEFRPSEFELELGNYLKLPK